VYRPIAYAVGVCSVKGMRAIIGVAARKGATELCQMMRLGGGLASVKEA